MAWGIPTGSKQPQNAWGKGSIQAVTQEPEKVQSNKEFVPLDSVLIESLTVLKMIKNSNDSSSGTLLGLDIDKRLEVTDCFAHPNDVSSNEYNTKMLDILTESYSDICCVGWYLITDCSPFATVETFEDQLSYQMDLDLDNTARCVLIVLDKSRISRLDFSNAIKAYRVKQSIVEERRKNKDADFSGTIFESIDVKLNTEEPALIQLYFQNIRSTLDLEDKLDDSLNLAHRSDLETCVGRLVEEVERLDTEQSRWNYYERQLKKQHLLQEQWKQKRIDKNKLRAERGEPLLSETDPLNPVFRPIPKPSKLEAALAKEQLNVYCSSLNKFSSTALPKLFSAQSATK